ncbi:hypothetical protein A2311_01605 [candidate division WOR-1 bacterium RIFOXYB2_FULL_48_7]|uniref:Cytochrome C biogenesis protein transmembrane domain-containing protein n=1 Tax=candidate division WOR-1 bacterium RIFOXYB2_FULL_48_7 TaxID=1802583 RepID=A0A1F4T8J3_UNCSA|nr:MAG: hypothetical protein A2311_01605 [candidate division WOR-1 bacterium RIFOXYB2_FULL_48_7]
MDFNNPLVAYFAVFVGGLAASVSPCVLSIIPLAIGYLGGYSGNDPRKTIINSLVFSLGLAVTFTLLGALAAFTGSLLGDIGGWWRYLVALVAIVMGLNLLGLIRFHWPQLSVGRIKRPGYSGTFLFGILFGLVSSPCATPILAVVLAFVAARQNVIYGISLLFVYALAYTTVIFTVGAFAGLAQSLFKSQPAMKRLELVNKSFGFLLIIFGVIWILKKLF